MNENQTSQVNPLFCWLACFVSFVADRSGVPLNVPETPHGEVQDDGADQILRIGGILVARLTGLEGQRQVDWQPTGKNPP